MVRLNRIYTRTGDNGTTGLVDGARVAKSSPRIAAIGTVEEANAALGLALLDIAAPDWRAMLSRIQNELFDLGADLATPEAIEGALRIIPSQVDRLERDIDALNEGLEPLRSFILPGGSRAAAGLHLARTIVRRAERQAVATAEEGWVNPLAIAYLNRLSDHLFVLARAVNAGAGGDPLWRPGATRDD